jgi:pSer/pThr/pTyr-binding forkhead associated (FHA) protein
MIPSRTDLFSADCGMDLPLRLDVTWPGQEPRRLTFAQPYVLLGRGAGATLRFDHPDISLSHAYMQGFGGRLFVADLESRHGISIGGVPAPSGWLEPGQDLSLGPFRLACVAPPDLPPVYPAPPENPLEGLPTAGGSPRAVAFDVSLGNGQISRWRMPGTLAFVGSSARCRVRLRDLALSRFHCGLVATPGGVWVIDLLSRTGTRLNGEKVACARLKDGDTLEAGSYRLRVDYHGRSSHAPALMDHTAGDQTSAVSAFPAPDAGPPTVILSRDRVVAEHGLLLPLMQEFSALQQHMFDQFQQTMVILVKMLSSMHQEQVSLIREELQQFQKATEELQRLQHQAQPSTPRPEARRADPPGRWQPGTWPGAKQPEAPAAATPTPPPPPKAEEGREPASQEAVHAWLHQRIAELQEERQSRWQRLLGFIRRS